MEEAEKVVEEAQGDSASDPDSRTSAASSSFWNRYKAEMGLAAVVLYVFLLALGTIGELFNVEWILDLPLFRPPGKY
ncbi:MAG: hypothetical protein G3M70_06090 [Candidatus Nitronauta litoralis]|uniref:Uncharacterized protein n=1 Tax=Candidatus Nitronauta litoralis TaxID=2705533 RepID=A0A7T0BSZ6_9BACT|nr:MAG: hypothetical protein G3M70_06090 [Candidatus Nitronauta litoralis]